MRSFRLAGLVALACLPVSAVTLFSDLGASDPLFNDLSSNEVAGTGGCCDLTQAMEFAVAGSGAFSVTQLDLAVEYYENNLAGETTFSVSIYTVSSGAPGALVVPAATWTASTPTGAGESSSALVSITGITGVTLTGGTSYFLVVGPSPNTSANTQVGWYTNNQSVTGDHQVNEGVSWLDQGSAGALGAFDLLGTATTEVAPEPSALLLSATALAGLLFGFRRRKSS